MRASAAAGRRGGIAYRDLHPTAEEIGRGVEFPKKV